MTVYFILSWILSFALASFILYTWRRSKYLLPPGPKRLPVIGNLHLLGHQSHRSLWQLSRKHGPLMHLQLGSVPTVVVSSAEMAREVLNAHDADFCSRPKFAVTNKITYDHSDVNFSPYGEHWRQMRRILKSELFSTKKVESLHQVREEEVALLVRKVSSSFPGPVNLSDLMVTFGNNMICDVALGAKYQARDYVRGELHKSFEEMEELLACFFFSDYFPWAGRIIDRISGMTRKLDKKASELDALYEEVIEEHLDTERAKSKHYEDIVDLLLKYVEDDSVHFSRTHLKAVLADLVFAGTETTSYTTVWAMSELARNPDKMKRAQDEIRSCAGTKGRIEQGDLEKLQYIKAVIKETLRLHCPVPLLLPRVAGKHSRIAGYDVLPETRVLVNAWGICRDPKTWEDPEEFLPDRFLSSSIDFRGHDLEFIPFGSGRRICPGMNFGVASIELALANLLYHFDWEMPDGVRPEDMDMEEVLGLVIHKKTPLRLVAIQHKMH